MLVEIGSVGAMNSEGSRTFLLVLSSLVRESTNKCSKHLLGQGLIDGGDQKILQPTLQSPPQATATTQATSHNQSQNHNHSHNHSQTQQQPQQLC